MMKASGVSEMPRAFAAPLSSWRFASRSVMSDEVVLRDVRQVDPARLQPRTGNLLYACQRLNVDLTKFREIDAGHFRQTAAAT